jgi:DNA (cytosine-5)-methyltransferase 1
MNNSMSLLPSMTKVELLNKCKELDIKKCNSKKKSELINLIQFTLSHCDSKELKNTIVSNEINNEQKTDIKYTFIEVCAGAGGLSAGLIKCGFTPLLLNDNNKDCCKTLKHNHPHANVICESMDKIDYSKFTNVDLLTGGVPCQSFSQAGSRKGLEDPRGDLMIKFIEIITIIKPKVFMIENVKGLLTHDKGNTIKKIILTMNNDLYNITYKCLDASKYDVPQKRERVFIVGVLKGLKAFEFPKEGSKKLLKDVLYNVPESNGLTYNENKIILFKMIPQGGCWVNLPENLQKDYFHKHIILVNSLLKPY